MSCYRTKQDCTSFDMCRNWTWDTLGHPMRTRARTSHGSEGARVRIRKPRKRRRQSIIKALRRPILSLTKPATGAKARWERTQMLATQLSSSSVMEKSEPARSRSKSKRCELVLESKFSGFSWRRLCKILDDEMLAPCSKATRLMENPRSS